MKNCSSEALARCQKPPKIIALIGKLHSTETAATVALFARTLQARGLKVLLETQTASLCTREHALSDVEVCDFQYIGARADLAIVIGGDGTMLHAARYLAHQKIPLVGVNQGRLGFMADIDRENMLSSLDTLLRGQFVPEHRMLLQAGVWRDGECVSSYLALNEVVVEKGASARLIEFEVFIDQEFVYNLRADGLIVSTATGSTAYSLSANGAIIHPQLSAIALVPLCPHSLTNRPLLVGDHSNVAVGIIQALDSRVHFDGHLTVDLRPQDCVRIHRAEHPLCLLHPPGYSYFATLRKKLHWNEQIEAH